MSTDPSSRPPQPSPDAAMRIVGDLALDAAADAIMAVMVEAFDPRFGESWNRAQTVSMLCMPQCRNLLLLDANAKPLGFSVTRQIGIEEELLMLAVAPAVRGRGLANLLMNAIIEDARARGCETMHLEVRENNDARYFYADLGFVAVGRRKSYYKGTDGSRYDALTYAMPL